MKIWKIDKRQRTSTRSTTTTPALKPRKPTEKKQINDQKGVMQENHHKPTEKKQIKNQKGVLDIKLKNAIYQDRGRGL